MASTFAWVAHPSIAVVLTPRCVEGASGSKSGNKRAGQELNRGVSAGALSNQGAPGYTYGEVPVQPVPLKYVVQEASELCGRWRQVAGGARQ
jgi:hypothetical protein